MKNLFIFCALAAAVHFPGIAQAAKEFDYTAWERVLENYVDSEGRVDYEHLADHPEEIKSFARDLKQADITSMNENQEKAFWINAYNALTVNTIVDFYPVESIRKIKNVWKREIIVAGRKVTLHRIEHRILRPMGDARIHFALNCASLGCPKLPRAPFYGSNLDSRLDQEAKRFVNDPEKVFYNPDKRTLYVSKIFHWFRKDFGDSSGSILEFILKYSDSEQADDLSKKPIRIRSMKYDWSLNDLKRQ